MELIKGSISIGIILLSMLFFIDLACTLHQSSPQQTYQNIAEPKINGISYKDITHAELVKEPVQYIIIYTNTSAMTISKNDYLKIRDELMRYNPNIIEIGGN